MHFVPIPYNVKILYELRYVWGPFIPHIAARSLETEAELIDAVIEGRVQIGLIWDGEKAHALIGMIYRKAGGKLIGEVHWATGFGRKDWQHLLAEVEQHLKEKGCAISQPVCRPGWQPLLAKFGYKRTHVTMEKTL